MRSADVVLYIFDKQTESVESLKNQIDLFNEAGIKYILVGNKSDMSIADIDFTDETFSISAKENLGIETLKEALYQSTVNNAVNTDNTIVTNSRHLQALLQMKASLKSIKEGLDNNIPVDLLSIEIRSCLFHLGDITGEVTSEDKLDYIFSKFCIGK
jgi:tRNA modification GTPase